MRAFTAGIVFAPLDSFFPSTRRMPEVESPSMPRRENPVLMRFLAVSRQKLARLLTLRHILLLCFEIDQRLGLHKNLQNSPTGSGPGLLQGGSATNQYIVAAEVMLNDGHKDTKQMSTIACRLGRLHLEPSAGQGGYHRKVSGSIHSAPGA